MVNADKPQITYAEAGVDIEAADLAVQRIVPHVKSTMRPEVLGGLGGFGGMFALDIAKYREPVLVSGTDGVGTKSIIAQLTGRYDTIGIDLVATCTDDLVCQGAETLFFLDYISVGKMDPDMMEPLVAGVAEGCRVAGAALVGGEMSEHPGMMSAGEFDLVGFAVGVVERDAIMGPQNVRPGDVLVGLPSPNIRCNGYSLARKIFLDIAGRELDKPAWDGAAHTLAEELLSPSVIYAPSVLKLREHVNIHAAAHITGGGIPGNVVRILPQGVDAVIDMHSWERPQVFYEMQTLGNVPEEDMRRTFNLGIGMVLAVAAEDEHKTIDQLRVHGLRAMRIGEVVPGDQTVQLIG